VCDNELVVRIVGARLANLEAVLLARTRPERLVVFHEIATVLVGATNGVEVTHGKSWERKEERCDEVFFLRLV
jgi:hypothetical protein